MNPQTPHYHHHLGQAGWSHGDTLIALILIAVAIGAFL